MSNARARTGLFRLRPIPLAIAATFGAVPAVTVHAQQIPLDVAAHDPAGGETPDSSASVAPPPDEPNADSGDSTALDAIIVTATRRSESAQKVPINIFSISGEQIRKQGLTDLSDYTKEVPGLFLVDQGKRTSNQISVRGINVTAVGAAEGIGNNSGGVVATYVGDVPIYVDLKLLDIDRVESLLGPQGTLYGAGTLGGAIRYIPNRPDPKQATLSFSQDLYGQSHSAGIGSESQATINLPLASNAAIRATIGFFHGPGFIDYPYAVNDPGVSNPQPDLNDPAAVAANLHRNKDADSENTLVGRIGGLYKFGDSVTANLTYFFQRQEVGARTINNRESFGTGRYESGLRFAEPNKRKNQLLNLEIDADLGFATLTSATGLSRYDERGQRDQTDLLLSFEYGYEDFPSFAAFTREDQTEERLSQEIRLVSNSEGPFKWIGGVFYNTNKLTALSQEFVPGYPQFAGIDRPDNLEYYNPTDDRATEEAVFGEVGYQITSKWQVTVGGRYFRFRDTTTSGAALPLVDGSGPNQILPDLTTNSVHDASGIFKFNTSYQFSQPILGYATISQGYRTGGVNAVPLCDNPLPPGQNVCALPNEVLIKPDKTLNYELGLKTAWFGGRLTVNGDVYYIDWKNVQVGGTTVNGNQPITVNGARATSQGAELAIQGKLDRHWSVFANYSYNDARLSRNAPGIVGGADAFEGDRLPGSPINQGSVRLSYSTPIFSGIRMDAGYGINAIDGVLTKVGFRDNGERLGGYTLHKADIAFSDGRWRLRFYVNNLFDKYAETGVRADRSFIRAVGPNNFQLRSYYKDILPPRTFGATFSYDFDL